MSELERGRRSAADERERNERLLYDGIEAFNAREFERVKERYHPEIESHVAKGLGNPGTWTGLDGYDEMVGAWGEAFESQRLEVVAVEHPADGHVVAELHNRAVGAGSGVPVEMTLFYLFEIEDGLVTRFHIYGDREAALAAVR